MTNLNFIEKGNEYVAEFKAEGDFSLHIEKGQNQYIGMAQKSIEDGKYDAVDKFPYGPNDRVIDTEVRDFLAPKWFRITCSAMPDKAVVVSESDITVL